jgi:hypothetical protein
MVKCPFCHYENEDGALFCEQCKSDLAGVEAVKPPQAEAAPIPVAEPLADPLVPDTLPDARPFMAAVAECIPVAEVPDVGFIAVEALAVTAAPIATAPPIIPDTASDIPIPPPLTPAAEPVAQAATPPLTPSTPVQPLAQGAAPTVSTSSAAPTPAGAPAEPEAGALPPDAQPRLLVLRGQKRNVEYPIYEGHNFIGRADEKPVDIDLEDQEPPDRIWSSRQHAVITFENHHLQIEDLNSSNGTFVNRSRIHPGQPRPLSVNDVIQIGNVQLKVIS